MTQAILSLIALFLAALALFLQLVLLSEPDDKDDYIDDGFYHCNNCEARIKYGKDICKTCVYNKFKNL